MHRIVAAALAAGVAFPALAQEGPSLGCYMRDYSDAHLASHPDQVVDWIKLQVRVDEYNNTVAGLQVRFADQGHVVRTGHGGRVMDQFLICWSDPSGKNYCGVECDGGIMEFTRDDANGVVFRTNSLAIGYVDGCGGITNLAEVPGQYVSYRLDRVAPSVCGGN